MNLYFVKCIEMYIKSNKYVLLAIYLRFINLELYSLLKIYSYFVYSLLIFILDIIKIKLYIYNIFGSTNFLKNDPTN